LLQGKTSFLTEFPAEKETAPDISDTVSAVVEGQQKRRRRRPSATVFSFAYSFEYGYCNIYGFTFQQQNPINLLSKPYQFAIEPTLLQVMAYFHFVLDSGYTLIYSMLNQKSENPGIVSIQKICDGLEISVREFFDDPLFENLEQVIK